MSEIITRSIKEQDALALSHLYPHWGIERCKKRIKKSLSSASEFRFVAEANGIVVGHICVKLGHMHHEHIATIYSLIVDPSHRGKGIATKLIEHTIKKLPKRIEILLLQTQHDNTEAQSLFKKLGFEEYGYLHNAFKRNGQYKDNILMEKRL